MKTVVSAHDHFSVTELSTQEEHLSFWIDFIIDVVTVTFVFTVELFEMIAEIVADFVVVVKVIGPDSVDDGNSVMLVGVKALLVVRGLAS